jgi:hypothetical protein
MTYNPEDDCYCVHGVAERTQSSITAAWYFVLAFIGLTILQAVVSAIKLFVKVVEQAARGVASVADTVGWAVLSVVCFIVLALYVHDKVMNYIERRELPWYVSMLIKLRKLIRGYFYRRDLVKRFEERPELSLLTVEDIIADMNDGHHDGEEPPTKEEWAVYLEQFYKIKNESDKRSRTDRITGVDIETISHN